MAVLQYPDSRASKKKGDLAFLHAAFFVLALCVLPGCMEIGLLLHPDFADFPVDTSHYAIEELSSLQADGGPRADFIKKASFAAGNDVYLADVSGQLYRADDRDLQKPWISLGNPTGSGARLLFVSSRNVIFVCADRQGPTWRSEDNGSSWTPSLTSPVWRMDEDDEGSLYAGNYGNPEPHPASVYKSTDSGLTWTEVFRHGEDRHIHTVRWDNESKTLYIAFGDEGDRGRAYSADRGKTFTIIAQGPHEGHTDVAFTRDYIIWASDDQHGRVLRTPRGGGHTQTLTGRSQFMWFAVARDQQIYIGTVVSKPEGGERAAILASNDQGNTWQKLMETDVSAGPYDQGYNGESRQLSANGWVYFSDRFHTYRIRRIPDDPTAN